MYRLYVYIPASIHTHNAPGHWIQLSEHVILSVILVIVVTQQKFDRGSVASWGSYSLCWLIHFLFIGGTNGRPISTQSSVCESPPSDLARSTSTNDYFCSRCSSRATTTDCDSGCSSQPPSRRSTLPVPSLPLTLARSAVPRGPEASMDHSYETALTISHDHDYEDISDLEDSGEYVVFPPVSMKRNPSYSAFRIQPRRGAGGGLAGLVPEPIIMQNLSVCTDELCAHDYLEPVSSTNICTGSP